MLAKYYRFRVYNATKTPLVYANGARVEITWIPWKLVAGTLTYGSEVKQNTVFLNTGGTIAAYGQAEGSVVDNSSDLNLGLNGTFRVITDGLTELGSVQLFMETSSDNTVWPSDANQFKITSLEEVKVLPVKTTSLDAVNTTNFEVF